MSNQSKDRKITKFLKQTSLPSNAILTHVSSNTNYQIDLDDFQSSLGVTGTIEQAGNVLGTPILNTAGSVNKIRNLEPRSGIKTSVSPENGAIIEHNFIEDTTGVELVVDLTADQPKFRSIEAGAGINVSASNGTIQIALSGIPASTKTVIVNDINDFPAAVGGVITLEDDTEYAIRNDITTANRFVMGNNTVLSGSNNLVVNLTYTDVGTMFTSVNKSFIFSNLTFTFSTGTFIDFDGTGTEIFQMSDARLIGHTLGTIDDFAGIHFDDTQMDVTTDGFLFGGANGVILLEANLTTIDAGTLYDLGTATFNAFSVTDAFVTLNGTSVFLDGAASSANINAGSLGSIHNSRFFGTGTPLQTITVGDSRWDFHVNDKIQDSSKDVMMSQIGNATNTVIAVASTPVKLAGVWAEEDAYSFTTDATGKMTYTGDKDVEVNIDFSVSLAPVTGTNKDIALYAAKNGTVIANSKSSSIISAGSRSRVPITWRATLTKNDFIEVFVENNTDTVDILAVDSALRISD
jgi:hypothetical protein